MRSRWRAAALLVVLAAAVSFGLFWHFGSQPPDVDLATRPIPLTLRAYSQDPAATVDLSLEVTRRPDGTLDAELYVSTTSRQALLITSSLPDATASGTRFTRLPPTRLASSAAPLYVAVVSSSDELADLNAAAVRLAAFDLPAGAVTEEDGLYAARLPAVGQGDVEAVAGVAYQSTAQPGQVGADALYVGPAVASEADLRAEQGRPPAAVRTTFSVPQELRTSETLLGAREVVAHGDVTVNYPSNGTLEGDAFVWRGGFGVAPELTIVARDVQSRTNRYAFLSGIALATAAAALIALVQELPDRFRRRGERSTRGT